MKLKSVLAAALGSSILLGATATSASANTEVKVWCWDANFNVAAAQMAAERYQQTSMWPLLKWQLSAIKPNTQV